MQTLSIMNQFQLEILFHIQSFEFYNYNAIIVTVLSNGRKLVSLVFFCFLVEVLKNGIILLFTSFCIFQIIMSRLTSKAL